MGDSTHSLGFLPPDVSLVERFLADDCAPHEALHVRAWFGVTRDGDILADVVRAAIRDNSGRVECPERMRDAIWAQVRAANGEIPSKAPLPIISRKARSGTTRMLVSRMLVPRAMISSVVYGALGLMLVVCGLMSLDTSTPPRDGKTRSYSTQAGQIAQIQIDDGSRVILAPKSHLSLIEDPTNGARIATLTGEARFELVPNPNAPFEVRMGRIVTRVLGTTFDVHRYRNEPSGRITVHTGKVATSAMGFGTPLTLTAGMSAQFNDSVIVATNVTDSASYIDWEQGQIVFRDIPVPVLLEVLGRWYEYSFKLADSTLGGQHVTATFAFGETAEMLRLLQRVLGTTMIFQDSVVILGSERQ